MNVKVKTFLLILALAVCSMITISPLPVTKADSISPLGITTDNLYVNDFFGFEIKNNGSITFLPTNDLAEASGLSENQYLKNRSNYFQTINNGQPIIDFYATDFIGGSLKVTIMKSVDGFSVKELLQLTIPYQKEGLEALGFENVTIKEQSAYIAGKEAPGYIHTSTLNGQQLFGHQFFLEKAPYICMFDKVSLLGTDEIGPSTFIDDCIYPTEEISSSSDDIGQPIEELWKTRLKGTWKGIGGCFGLEKYEFDTKNSHLIFKFSSASKPKEEVVTHNYYIYDRDIIIIDGLRFEDNNLAALTWKNGYLELYFEDESQNHGYNYLVKIA